MFVVQTRKHTALEICKSFQWCVFKEFTLICETPDLVVSLLFPFGGRVGAGIMQSV
jgi:hypothetical protein